MKRLLILTAVSLAAGAGCKNCGLCGGGGGATSVYRPPSCTSGCTGGPQAYPAQGTYAAPGSPYAPPNVMAAPSMTVPQAVPGQTYPGPEVYTPAN